MAAVVGERLRKVGRAGIGVGGRLVSQGRTAPRSGAIRLAALYCYWPLIVIFDASGAPAFR